MIPQPSKESRWFSEEVQPHESALRAYLHARFPSLTDNDDIVQETYQRVLRAKETGRLRYVKAFLFTTARNAVLDLFRRKRPISMEAITDFERLSVLEDRPGVAEVVNQRQELEILTEAISALPDRCRQIIMLRYYEGLSYKEIAGRLAISPETVKVQIAKGIKRSAAYFQARGLLKSAPPKKEEFVP